MLGRTLPDHALVSGKRAKISETLFSWRREGVGGLRLYELGSAEVSEDKVPLLVEENVAGFEVSVDDVLGPQN